MIISHYPFVSILTCILLIVRVIWLWFIIVLGSYLRRFLWNNMIRGTWIPPIQSWWSKWVKWGQYQGQWDWYWHYNWPNSIFRSFWRNYCRHSLNLLISFMDLSYKKLVLIIIFMCFRSPSPDKICPHILLYLW